MAHRTLIQLVDDLDGTPIAPGEGETVSFALDGAAYEIDLSQENAAELRRALSEYISASRRLNATAGRDRSAARRARRDSSFLRGVRTWAAENDYEISDRGRIPQKVLDAYGDTHR